MGKLFHPGGAAGFCKSARLSCRPSALDHHGAMGPALGPGPLRDAVLAADFLEERAADPDPLGSLVWRPRQRLLNLEQTG